MATQAQIEASIDAPQRAFGYNDIYNFGFTTISHNESANVSYKSFISLFSEGEYSYRVEGWKGNYMQMGVGAEIGVYAENTSDRMQRKKDEKFYKFVCIPSRHYPVAPKSMWPEITLYVYVFINGHEEKIFLRPPMKHWWIDGFNPNWKNTHPDDIYVRVK